MLWAALRKVKRSHIACSRAIFREVSDRPISCPGSYSITDHLDDGRTSTADYTVNVEVQAAQIPAEAKGLETKLALDRVYFPTARPTVADPPGVSGESAESSGVTRNRFQSHLQATGPCNPSRATRIGAWERTKSFPVEHGISARTIEAQALGKQENLDAEQVKQLVEQNPRLSIEERKDSS
jgi:hypothetical protein